MPAAIVEQAQPDLHDAPEIVPVRRAMRNPAATQHLLGRVREIANPFCRESLEPGSSLAALDLARAEARRIVERSVLLAAPTATPAARGRGVSPRRAVSVSL